MKKEVASGNFLFLFFLQAQSDLIFFLAAKISATGL